jgi:hypothetical protein
LILKSTFIMKKVKIILTAITVFAVVGGALAFKAKAYITSVYTTTTPGTNALCPNLTPFTTITNVAPAPGAVQISVTSVAPIGGVAQPCVLSYTKFDN